MTKRIGIFLRDHMKRLCIICLGLILSFPSSAGTIEPFDVKVLRKTEFALCEALNYSPQYGGLQVWLLNKGVHVKILEQSSVNSGRLRVRLDDGSIGWIPTEALCERCEIEVDDRYCYPIVSETVTYQVADECWMYYDNPPYNRIFPLRDSDGDPTNWYTYQLSSDIYQHICDYILQNLLPEAYRHLPAYPRKYKTIYQIGGKPEKIDHLCGYSRDEIESMFGEPEGFAGPGLSMLSGYTIAFYDKVGYNNDMGYVHPGILVVYDNGGLARAVLTTNYLSVDMSGPNKPVLERIDLEPRLNPDSQLVERTIASVRTRNVYKDIYTPAHQTYGVPDYIVEPEAVTTDSAPVKPKRHSFREALIRLFILWLVFKIAARILSDRPQDWSIQKRLMLLLPVGLIAFPYPAGLFSGSIGFIGWLELLVGGFIIYVIANNFVYYGKRQGKETCPKCKRWCRTTLSDVRLSNIVGEDVTTPAGSPRKVIGSIAPTSTVRRTGVEDSRLLTKSGIRYMVETEMYVKYDRTAVHHCSHCGHQWTKTEHWSEKVRGPILFTTRVTESEDWEDVTKVDTGDGMREVDRTPRSEKRYYDEDSSYDYERYEPYFNAYYKNGDKDALDRYYRDYFE